MKKIMGLCLIGVIITIAFYPVTGGTFQEKPLINHTGYTLRQGGLKVNCCWFIITTGHYRFVPGVEYGVTNNFQLGVRSELRNFFPYIFLTGISGKYHLLQITTPKIDLAIPFDWYRTGLIENEHISEWHDYLSGGIATTLTINKDLHFNTKIATIIRFSDVVRFSPYVSTFLDVNILPNIKLISGLRSLASFSPSRDLVLSISILARIFHFLDLNVRIIKYLYADFFMIRSDLHLRF